VTVVTLREIDGLEHARHSNRMPPA
jgi:hypothetical protein